MMMTVRELRRTIEDYTDDATVRFEVCGPIPDVVELRILQEGGGGWATLDDEIMRATGSELREQGE